MKNNVLFLAILCLLNSFLFYKINLGLNVVLFTTLMSVYLVYELKINKQINNKKGLLFLIPILILSCTYFMYDNIFNKYNKIVIPILYFMMFIYTINPIYNLTELFNTLISMIFEPIDCISSYYKSLDLTNEFNISQKNQKKLRSFFIVIPLIIIVLLLLTSADMMFNNLFAKVFSILNKFSLRNIIGRIILMVMLFSYTGGILYYLYNKFKVSNEKTKNDSKTDNYTIKLLLTSLNFIYIVFDVIQIRSLIFHHVSSNINYASYARTGFFQLMAISLLNIIIILLSKKYEETKYIKTMSIVNLFLTLIIISSSFLRMYMYESAYGYTLLRLLVYAILITEVIMLIPTTFYIINSKINVIKYYMIILISVYTGLNLISVDYIIAKNNIDRYYETNKIDIDYLKNDGTDNIELLAKLYEKTTDKLLKKKLEDYFIKCSSEIEIQDFRDYNVSKSKAENILENIIFDEL